MSAVAAVVVCVLATLVLAPTARRSMTPRVDDDRVASFLDEWTAEIKAAGQ